MFKGSGSIGMAVFVSGTVRFSGRMGAMSVYEGLSSGGRGWGKRDDSVNGMESDPIYTCDEIRETSYVVARESERGRGSACRWERKSNKGRIRGPFISKDIVGTGRSQSHTGTIYL